MESHRRVKLCHNDSIRMVRVPVNENLEALKETIRKTFDELQSSLFVIKYQDPAGEDITVASDADLGLALEDLAVNNSVPKFTIHKAVPVAGVSKPSRKDEAPCKFYQGGYCRYGDKCKFSHSTSSKARTFSSARNIESWLEAQVRRSAADNTEFLSSTEGLRTLRQAADSAYLTQETANMLARLVTKEEMRASMLRQDTNKIYACLMQSRFIMQLQVHINNQRPLTAENLEPFVLLIEELQFRIADGWKILPLDTIKSLIDAVPQSPLKDELARKMMALLEHRRKLQLIMATSDPDTSLKGPEFRIIPIIPSKEELLQLEKPADVPVNKVGLRYTSVVEYLETHFKLLREDFIEPLRVGIRQFQNGAGYMSEVRVYRDVQLQGIRPTASGMEIKISFVPEQKGRQIDWEHSKRLMYGSLLCVSRDNFHSISWATVIGRKDLRKHVVDIRLVAGDHLDASVKYVMIESTAAYFEAYSHVLKSLQREDMESLPFKEHLISLEQEVKEPSYLMHTDLYDFRDAFPQLIDELGQSTFHILQRWPEWSSTLDPSQMLALKHGLTKGLALIQGPPGTGKTFIGLLIVKLLLANLKRQKFLGEVAAVCAGPILVVCYTNHALDQFLTGIYKSESNVIRIGARCKSNELAGRNLQLLLQKAKQDRTLTGAHVRKAAQAREQRQHLEAEMTKLANILNQNFMTREQLHGVATEEQIQNLFYSGDLVRGRDEETLAAWLQGERYQTFQEPNIEELRPEDADSGVEDADKDVENADSDVEDTSVVSSEDIEGADDFEDQSDVPAIPTLPIDDGWLQVTRKDLPQRKNPEQNDQQEPHLAEMIMEDEIPLHLLVDVPDVWSLHPEHRKRLHAYWLDEVHAEARKELSRCTQEFEAACNQSREADNEIQLSLLRRSNVIGMTTSAAARLHDTLVALKPEIVIVEEAAEVLESHILACLSPYTRHLILIGDHLQLRPSVATHKLAVNNHLDVSMFERLVRSGVEHVMLKNQRRMKPCISNLISEIYPKLQDHPSVLEYEDVKGMSSSLFFMDHDSPEEAGHEAGSKVNVHEAMLIVELCNYLLNQQQYKPEQITILAMYKGQVQEIIRRLRDRLRTHRYSIKPVGFEKEVSSSEVWLPRVSSVDDFQGEENEVILLSLVRSNLIPRKEGPGTIGFLNIANRVCVALSRARKGLYIFGNAQLLRNKSPLWRSILQNLTGEKLVGSKLLLRCQNHPDVVTSINQVEDFLQVEDGGCSKACEYQLDCGHACPRMCHPGSHNSIVCPKTCSVPLENCVHRCMELCHSGKECPPCRVSVVKRIPSCGHEQSMACSEDPKTFICTRPCEKLLSCGHKCSKQCGRPCSSLCHEVVVKELPCGHEAKTSCCQDISKVTCMVPCGQLLEECNHTCQGTCGKCKQGAEHIPCQKQCGRDLPCGHQCVDKCFASCPPCPQRCQKRCVHSVCSSICGEPCKPCLELCAWRCQHFRCELLCSEVCQRPRCNEPCRKILRRCRHPCIGLCGEPCPTKCRICHPKTFDVITQMALEETEDSDRFVQLLDCGHIFEVTGLDQWMDINETSGGGAEAIVLKFCPECKTPIRRTYRYANIVKKKLQQIETVKMRVYGYDKTKRGFEMLDRKDYRGAAKLFVDAIRIHPGLHEAHLGIARVLCQVKEFGKATAHLQVILGNSQFRSEVEHLPLEPLKTYNPLPSRAGVLTTVANRAVAIQAFIQLASALTGQRQFSEAVRVCELVLKHDRENEIALQVKRKAEQGVTHQVVEAVSATFAYRGHWFECPNGHVYVVGECGGPMETSRCPDCGATIGGERHAAAAGNRHSTIDGSARPAFPQ